MAEASAAKVCQVEGCGGKVLAKNYCCKHYYQFKRHGRITDGARQKQTGCTVDGCSRPHYARGYCSKHYQQLLKKGNPVKGASKRSSKLYCAAPSCKHTVFNSGFCRLHYIKMRSLQMLAEAHPERVKLPENQAEATVTAGDNALNGNLSYDDQLREAYAFVSDQ